MFDFNKVINSLIGRRVSSKFIRRTVNDKIWFNEDCVNAFYNKQNAYRFWSQNSSPFLWEEYVVPRRYAQYVYDAALLEYNNVIHSQQQCTHISGGLLLRLFFLV